MLKRIICKTSIEHLIQNAPENPVLYFSPSRLKERIALFQNDFSGLVSFAVKCNPDAHVLREMIANNVDAFDVASPFEIDLIRHLAPDATLHYNNPIRAIGEIKFALDHNVRSFSVDCASELEKIASFGIKGIEISVRLKLDKNGAVYHFGSKFGTTEEEAIELLKKTASYGFIPSMTFHVGTQCKLPSLYGEYIEAAARCSQKSGIKIKRLNVGGGFPANRAKEAFDYTQYFDEINRAIKAFGAHPPALLCEPGRALVTDAFEYLVQIKSIQKGRWIFLNDGIYGGMSEYNIMGLPSYRFYSANGVLRDGENIETSGYGPTCDSIDSFEEQFQVPSNVEEGDYALFAGAGAYIIGPNTRFNGYGNFELVEVDALSL